MTTPAVVAVTGAGGYLGGRLVPALAPAPVRALTRQRLPWLSSGSQHTVDLVGGPAALAAAFTDVDAVVHLAGHNEVVASRDPERALGETLLMSSRVAQAAGRAGVRRIVYVSTVHVYGSRITDGAELHEDLAPAPTSTYAIARLASEHLLNQAAQQGVEVVVLRLTNAVGAPADPAVDRWTLVASDLCRQAARDDEVVLRSAGLQWRDFVALRDVTGIIARFARDAALPPGTYNVGSGRATTVRDLAELVASRFERHTGRRPTVTAPPADGPPPAPYHVCVDRLAELGLRAPTSLEDAVDELAEFCLKQLARA